MGVFKEKREKKMGLMGKCSYMGGGAVTHRAKQKPQRVFFFSLEAFKSTCGSCSYGELAVGKSMSKTFLSYN